VIGQATPLASPLFYLLQTVPGSVRNLIIISFTERKSGTIQKVPCGFRITTELKNCNNYIRKYRHDG